MMRFALHSFFSRKLRAFLTALAIVLGVGMICGTYVLTDSMQNALLSGLAVPLRDRRCRAVGACRGYGIFITRGWANGP